MRKWRKRGEHAVQDRSSRPKRLPWRVTEEERAIICALRRATGFPLDDLTFVLRHFLPHLNRDNIYRVLKAEGLNRRPAKPSTLPTKGQGRFREYDLGYIHIDVKHLPKLRTADGEIRKRYLYVAIDRCSRFVHLAVYDAENAANAVAFLSQTRKALPFRITHVLTDRGSCFTADSFEEACAKLRIIRRMTKPYTPQTNGMVERFNGRVASEVLGINVTATQTSKHCSSASTMPIIDEDSGFFQECRPPTKQSNILRRTLASPALFTNPKVTTNSWPK